MAYHIYDPLISFSGYETHHSFWKYRLKWIWADKVEVKLCCISPCFFPPYWTVYRFAYSVVLCGENLYLGMQFSAHQLFKSMCPQQRRA